MIDVKSLMIGNLIEYNSIYCKIESILSPRPVKDQKFDNKYIIDLWDGGGLISSILESIYPIPLTPEILEKCGFVEKGVEWELPLGALKLKIRLYGDKVYTEIGNSLYLGDRIKYLHQLQNFYYQILGKQLEINL